MSKTVSTCICETNLIPNNPQENVFFHTLYRQQQDFTSEFVRTANSTSPIQICALFSTQGPDNLGAYLNLELNKELTAIVADISKNSVLDFDSFAARVVNTLNVKVCEFVVNKGGTPLKTSMTLVAIEGDILRVINIGNTRAVLIRDGRIFSISEEQTVAHRYVKMGVISAEQEATHPENMTLTQYLGKMPQDGAVQADTKIHLKLKDNDEICIMGIGISKKLPASLRNRVLVNNVSTEVKCKELISAAFNNEVKAGMTAIVIKIESVFLLPGDAVIGGDPGHEVAAAKKQVKEEASYTDFTKENNDMENTKAFREDLVRSEINEEGDTTMFNSGKLNADKIIKDTNKKEGKGSTGSKIKNILIPILILLLFIGIGYLIMFIAFHAAHLINVFEKKPQETYTAENVVMYALLDNTPVYAEDNLDSAIIGVLSRGDAVTRSETGESFSKIKTGDGVEGYVLNVQLSEEDPTINDELPVIESDPTPTPEAETTETAEPVIETDPTTTTTEGTTATTTTTTTTEATTTTSDTEPSAESKVTAPEEPTVSSTPADTPSVTQTPDTETSTDTSTVTQTPDTETSTDTPTSSPDTQVDEQQNNDNTEE
ncbi:MAG: hypothetical protein K6F83_05270 [Clostridiales bacterium]|nr:hypothetical protein [Clostridiales bacterium]